MLALFGEGLLLGLDTLVAQAFGAGKRADCHRSLINGVYLSIALTPILSAPIWLMPRFLNSIHVAPSLVAETIPYTNALTWGLFPLLLYFAVRRCLQAMNMVRPVAFALVTANIVNAVGNWILIYGKWGAPAMGTVGSGWSTAIARIYMAALLIGYLFWYDRKHRTELLKTPIEIDLNRIKQLIALGIPAAIQFTLETGVFATVTTLIAKLGPVPLATHQIALNTVAFTYMVPLGISSAAAVRVGQALGRKDPRGAGIEPNAFHGAAFMTLAGVVLLVVRDGFAHLHQRRGGDSKYTLLLAAGAVWCLMGFNPWLPALRGGDTRTPMLCISRRTG